MVLEAGKSKVKVLADLVFGSQMAALSPCPHVVERKALVSLPLFIRTLISSWRL